MWREFSPLLTIINLSPFPLGMDGYIICFSLQWQSFSHMISIDIHRYHHPYMLPMPLLVYSLVFVIVTRSIIIIVYKSIFVLVTIPSVSAFLIIARFIHQPLRMPYGYCFHLLRIPFLIPCYPLLFIFLISVTSFVFYSLLFIALKSFLCVSLVSTSYID